MTIGSVVWMQVYSLCGGTGSSREDGRGGGWGSEDTSCYTSKHPTSSADVTEIGEKKREKKKKCHTAALLYALLRLMQHFKQGSSSMHEQHVIVEKGFGLFFFKSQTTRLPLTSIYTFKKKKKKKGLSWMQNAAVVVRNLRQPASLSGLITR